MPLISIVLSLVVVGLVLWLLEKYVPMEPTIKRAIHIIVVVVVVIWLLKVFGLWGYLFSVHV